MEITLTLEKLDALAIIGALEDGALSWRMQAAISTGEERAYAEMRAASLKANAVRLIDALYPEQQTAVAS